MKASLRYSWAFVRLETSSFRPRVEIVTYGDRPVTAGMSLGEDVIVEKSNYNKSLTCRIHYWHAGKEVPSTLSVLELHDEF